MNYATAPSPFRLDYLVFVPAITESESAFHMDGDFVGEFEIDEVHGDYRARKLNFFGGFDDWWPMRSAAEARAFLVSDGRSFPRRRTLPRRQPRGDSQSPIHSDLRPLSRLFTGNSNTL
jgi:hypothetical protein